MTEMQRVFDPTAPCQNTPVKLRRALDRLEGKVVGFIGLPGYEFVTWNGILAPKGSPAATVVLLNGAIRKTLGSRELVQRMNDHGLDVTTSSPQEFSMQLNRELAKWGPVIKARHMRAE